MAILGVSVIAKSLIHTDYYPEVGLCCPIRAPVVLRPGVNMQSYKFCIKTSTPHVSGFEYQIEIV